jgi:leader peptidase (prepilin peptidase)/N-methyltransferase
MAIIMLAFLCGLPLGRLLNSAIDRLRRTLLVEASWHAPRRWRRWLLELLCALCFSLLAWRLTSPWLLAGSVLLFVGLIMLTAIDLECGLLPDLLTLPLLWCGLLFHLHTPALSDAVIGAVAGYLLLWGLYWVYRALRGREGLGYGDMKLLAALGAWLGWAQLPQVLLLSSLTGLLAGGILMLFGRQARDDPMPFGPFLAGSGWLVWVYGVCF